MSQANIINWQASSANTATIAPVQTLAAAGALQLNTSYLPNNTLAFPNNTNPNGPFIYDQVIRTILLTSTTGTSNAGVDFTINGIGAISPYDIMVPITETITGPAAGPGTSVESDNVYTQINSITANGAVTALSVGFGTSGITNFIFPDTNRYAWFSSCSAQVIHNAGGNYTANISLNKPSYPSTQGNLLPFIGGQIPAFPVSVDMITASDNQIAQINAPFATLWFEVVGNAVANVDESFIFTFIQQGIS